MTHYTIVVFDKTENVAKLLEPYNENTEVDWYKRNMVSGEDINQFMEYYRVKHPDQRELPLEELYALYGRDWHGDGAKWEFTPYGVEYWSTYNPKSKWDYYTIIGTSLPDFVPFSFVTPDGEWHTKGKMGWWAISWDEKDDQEWEKEYKAAVEKYRTRQHTIVDIHI